MTAAPQDDREAFEAWMDADGCYRNDAYECAEAAWQASRRQIAEAEPVAVAMGDYVLATKWNDGDPGDHWGVGFYDGERNGRHYVIDSAGEQIRGNGFRRVGRITPEIGKWLLGSAAALEAAPPGAVNLWNVIAARAAAPDHKEDKMDLKKIVDRFLGWPLPKSFSPDCGITFDGRKDDEWNKNKTWPIGTNLFTFSEALAMFEHALELEEPSVMGGGWVRDCPAAAPAAPAPDAEILRSELDRAWNEVDVIARQRDEHARWRQDLADKLDEVERHRDAIGRALNKRENDLMEALNALGQIVTMADRAIGCSPSEQDDYLAKISDLARKVALR